MKLGSIRILIYLFVTLLLLGGWLKAGNNQWTKLGPPGVGVLWIAIDPVTPAKVYLAPCTFNTGIFRTTTGGGSWTQFASGIKEVFVYCLAINRTKPQILYAAGTGGGNGGVYKSINSGSSWARKTVGSAENDIKAIAIDPTNFQILYAGSASQGVWQSTDSGEHWTHLILQDGGETESSILSLAIDPAGMVYAGTSSGVWKSSNGGSTWQRKGSSQLDKMVRTLAISLTNTQVLYAGVYEGFIYKTENGGDSWTAQDNGHGSAQNVYSIAIDPVQNETVYVASAPFGFFKTTNGGADWSGATSGLKTLSAISIAAVGQGSASPTLYLGTGDGVYRSVDRGSSWAETNTGLSHHYIPRGVTAVGPQTLYVPVHLAGIAKSTDGGSTWEYKNNGLDNFYPNYLTDGPGGALYLASALGYGVFKSVDGGDNWTKKSSGLPAGDVNAIAAYNDTEVYAGTLGDGVYKTLNGGDSWEPKSSGLPSGSVSTMAVDRINHIIYAAMFDTTDHDGLYKTADGGETWIPAHPYLANVGYMPFLVPDPADPTTLFVGVEGSYFGYGIFKLTGSGAGAELLLYGLIPPSAFAVDPADSQKLYAGAGDGKGVIVSASGGLGWAFINKGMPANNIMSLALNPSSPTTVWAGTDRGSVLSNTVSAYLIVKSPNGLSVPDFLEPENWNRGSVQAIAWDSTGVSGTATLQLYRNGKKLGKIASVPASAGTYNWIVGKYGTGTAPGGTGYQIRIQSQNNLSSDMSDGSFIIIAPTISVTAPNGGESWTRGDSQGISWITTGISGGDIIIQLYRNGTRLGDISTVPYDSSPYAWTVGSYSGATAPLGGGYKIKIRTPDGKTSDLSNAAFTIK